MPRLQGIFNGLTQLQELEINVIKSISPNFFDNMIQLEILKLKGHNLIILPENMLKHNEKLKTFELTGGVLEIVNLIPEDLNQLQLLPKNIFKFQKKLDLLDLSENLLRNLTDGLFDSLISLKVLKLSNNKLSIISK